MDSRRDDKPEIRWFRVVVSPEEEAHERVERNFFCELMDL